MKNYLNVHVLNSLAFANPNRDDAGAPKTVYYGGVERARMSSQSLKRAARISFEEKTQSKSIRTSHVSNLVEEILVGRGVQVDDNGWEFIDMAIRTLVESDPKKKKRPAEGQEKDAEDSGDTLMWVSQNEVEALADVLEVPVKEGGKLSPKDVKQAVSDALDNPQLSIAAFGRMFANSVENSVDASVQVAHAVSTHMHAIEVDYFTAIDDLQMHGAGHIGLDMFTGAVYYRHFVIDRAQLAANCGDSLDSLSSQLATLIEALILELPRGKQTTTAHQSLASFVMAVESSRPANFVEAFERPVRSTDDGFMEPSVEALAMYCNEVKGFVPEVFGTSWVSGRASMIEHFPDSQDYSLDALVKEMATWAGTPAR